MREFWKILIYSHPLTCNRINHKYIYSIVYISVHLTSILSKFLLLSDKRCIYCGFTFVSPLPVTHQLEFQLRHGKILSQLTSQSFPLTDLKRKCLLGEHVISEIKTSVRSLSKSGLILICLVRCQLHGEARVTESCKILALDKRMIKTPIKLATLVRSKATYNPTCFSVGERALKECQEWKLAFVSGKINLGDMKEGAPSSNKLPLLQAHISVNMHKLNDLIELRSQGACYANCPSLQLLSAFCWNHQTWVGYSRCIKAPTGSS